jgi:hypothetical protein
MNIATQFPTPTADLADLTSRLGAKGIQDRRLVHWLALSEAAGIFELMAERGPMTLDEVASSTVLNECGADVLLGIVTSLGVIRKQDGRYTLSEMAHQYLVKSSPYYFGDVLFAGCSRRIPNPFLREPHSYFPLEKRVLATYWWLKGFGTEGMLKNQHGRNLAPNVVAAQTGRFDGITHLLDVGGGTGTFAMPFARKYPDARVTLTDLPRSVSKIRPYLVRYGLENRIRTIGMDMFRTPWPISECDGVFLGNIVHTYDDEGVRFILKESLERLVPGGRVYVHEVLWNENKDGPLIAALWNGTLRRFTNGRQRTGSELENLLSECGFGDLFITPTAGGFSIVEGKKPGSSPKAKA